MWKIYKYLENKQDIPEQLMNQKRNQKENPKASWVKQMKTLHTKTYRIQLKQFWEISFWW